MTDQPVINRSWMVELLPDEVRMRCSYRRRLRRITQFVVQLEAHCDDAWHAIVRNDNAHGCCHRDTLHADGTQDKEPIYFGSANQTFTRAMSDLRTNWREHHARFLRERQP